MYINLGSYILCFFSLVYNFILSDKLLILGNNLRAPIDSRDAL